jgi:hypothetical protein
MKDVELMSKVQTAETLKVINLSQSAKEKDLSVLSAALSLNFFRRTTMKSRCIILLISQITL